MTILLAPANPPELAAFLSDFVIAGNSPKTAQSYGIYVRTLLAHAGVAIPELTVGHVRAWLLERTTSPKIGGGPRAASTVHCALKAVKALSKWALARGIITQDFTAGIKGPRPHDRMMRPPEPATIAALIDQAGQYGASPLLRLRNVALFTLAFDTGCRIQELLNLNIGNVHDGQAVCEAILIRTLKHGHDRILALNPEPRKHLSAYLAERYDLASDRPLFVDMYQKRMRYVAARNLIQRVRERAGVGRVGWHDARRAAATALRAAGINELDLQQIGGWRSLTMVKRYSQAAAAATAMQVHRTHSPLALIRAAGTAAD